MASPAKVSGAPATLPADFFDKQGNGPPETLPADFDFGNTPASTEHPGLVDQMRANWHSNTDPLPNDQNSMMTGAENYARGTAREIGHVLTHPLDAVREMGEGSMASGVTPYGTPNMAPTGNRERDENNQQAVSMARDKQAEGGKQMAAHPAYALGEASAPLLMGAGIKGAMEVPGEVSEINPFPTRAKAGALFGQVMDAAGDKPVNLSPETMKALERTQQLTMAGSKPFGTADKLYQRINTVNPLPYREARDFAQNMSLSPEERMSLKGSMRKEIPNLSHSFNRDIGDTAESVGMRPQFEKAMKDYATASRMSDIAGKAGNTLAKYGVPAAVGAGGLEAYHLLKDFF